MPKLSEAEVGQRFISKAEKVAINKAVTKALKLKPINYETRENQERKREKRRQYTKELLTKKRQLTRERMKPLLAFMKKYYKDHYYFNSKKLAKEYGVYCNIEVSPRIVLSFSRILCDLRDLGAITKHNARQYRKVINPDKY